MLSEPGHGWIALAGPCASARLMLSRLAATLLLGRETELSRNSNSSNTMIIDRQLLEQYHDKVIFLLCKNLWGNLRAPLSVVAATAFKTTHHFHLAQMLRENIRGVVCVLDFIELKGVVLDAFLNPMICDVNVTYAPEATPAG